MRIDFQPASKWLMVVAMVCGLVACEGRSESFRYKLTVSMNTPTGVKTVSSVTERRIFEALMPITGSVGGIGHQTTGQALYMDLGPGQRPLVLLLDDALNRKGMWSANGPNDLFTRACPELKDLDGFDWTARVRRCSKPIWLSLADLPTLLTFANHGDMTSAELVIPGRMADALGAGVSFRSALLQLTDEPVTAGLEKALPWIAGPASVMVHPMIRDASGNHVEVDISNMDPNSVYLNGTFFAGAGG